MGLIEFVFQVVFAAKAGGVLISIYNNSAAGNAYRIKRK